MNSTANPISFNFSKHTMNLGETIKLCRKTKGITQGELAKRADISVSHLCLIEKNNRDPSLSCVQSIATALQIPLSVLVFLAANSMEIPEIEAANIDNLSRNILRLMDDASKQESLF